MKTVIMAGGFGTRLRPLTMTLPKPMVPMGNLPMLDHIINLLKAHNLTDFITLLYFHPEVIKNYYLDGSAYGVTMNYMLAEEDLGTAGSVKNSEYLLDNQRVLVISGDVLTDFDLTAAIKFHKDKKAAATMVLTRLENPLSYGVVITEEDGKITRFMEKPTWGEVFSDTINTGIYILEPEVLEMIPKGEAFDFSQNLFPEMLEKKMPLYGYVADGYWRDVGNLSEYMHAHIDILKGKVKLNTKYNSLQHGDATISICKNVHVDESVKFEGNVILGDEVDIAPGAIITNSVIGDNCKIGASAIITNSTIWRNTSIGERTQITQAVVCNDVILEEDVSINEDAVISEKVTVHQDATVRANCKIWPGKEVEAGSVVSSSLVWGEKWNRELFTDSKVSGLGNIEITPEFAAKLGSAFSAPLTNGSSLIVSRDVSSASRIFSRAFITGALSCGVDVVDLRTLPIPVIRYELKSGRHSGGLYIRHNPLNSKMTDMIFLGPDGMDLSTRRCRSIELLFAREDFRRADITEVGQLDYPTRTIESYRFDFLKNVDAAAISKRKFKLVIDFANGGASEVFSNIFSMLDCDVISLNAYPDPTSPFSRKEYALDHLASIVKSINADLGIHLSRSAEKLTIIDRNGETISDQLMLLLYTALYLKLNQAKKIATPVMGSMGMEQIAGQYGVTVIRVRNDHLAMMQAYQQDDIGFVGGTRGGFILSPFQLGTDGMFAAVKLLEMLALANSDLADLRKKYDKYHACKYNVPCAWAKKGQVMRLLITHTENITRQLVDGVRFFEEHCWVLIAPDRNQAYFTVYVESEDKTAAEKLADKYRKKVKEWQA